MNVWQFSAEEMEKMSPELAQRRVFFSGTHDNDTLVGWCGNKDEAEKILDKLWATACPWVIAPIQDVLGLDSSARLNVPGTAEGNWKWRLSLDMLTPDSAQRLLSLTLKHERKNRHE
jgi:4-alpha-glucanotransferase